MWHYSLTQASFWLSPFQEFSLFKLPQKQVEPPPIRSQLWAGRLKQQDPTTKVPDERRYWTSVRFVTNMTETSYYKAFSGDTVFLVIPSPSPLQWPFPTQNPALETSGCSRITPGNYCSWDWVLLGAAPQQHCKVRALFGFRELFGTEDQPRWDQASRALFLFWGLSSFPYRRKIFPHPTRHGIQHKRRTAHACFLRPFERNLELPRTRCV